MRKVLSSSAGVEKNEMRRVETRLVATHSRLRLRVTLGLPRHILLSRQVENCVPRWGRGVWWPSRHCILGVMRWFDLVRQQVCNVHAFS